MTVTYFPYQAGAGAPVNDLQWQMMMSLLMRDGVWANTLNTLAVTAGAGLQVLVNTGDSMTNGIFMNNSASFAIALAAADPTNPRKDNIVVHADLVARTVTLIALTGTPAGSPVVPAVTQNATVWEISIQNVTVLANAGAPSSFVDTRTYTPNWPIIYQQSGVAEVGSCGLQVLATGASSVYGQMQNFKRTMQVAPSSLTFVTILHTNATGQFGGQVQTHGFFYGFTATSAISTQSLDQYTTVGNCLRAIRAGAFDIHCDTCEERQPKLALKRGRSLYHDLEVIDALGTTPGNLALRHLCPDCGTVESFNTALGSRDESLVLQGWEQRPLQAYLIREAQARRALPLLL